jgi:hypothetical protein
MSAARNEIKYQYLKLVHSGRTLAEAKALVRATAAGLHPEYASAKDLKDLGKLEGLNHLLMTRPQAIDLMKLKLKPTRAYPSTREESIAKWATGYRGKDPLDWRRDGNLKRRGRPNKPKPGSSAGKVKRSVVRGADKTLRDFDRMVRELQGLMKKHGRKNTGQLRKAFKSIRTGVSTGITGGDS